MLSAGRTFAARATLLFGAAIALALSQVPDATAQGDWRMAVDCEGNTRAIETACQFGSGQEFTVSVHVVEAPGEYAGVQAKVRWDGSALDYLPAEAAADEVAWQECTLPLRLDLRPDETAVTFGCGIFTGDPDEPLLFSSHTGPTYLFRMRCINDGATDLILVPLEGDVPVGTHFVDANGFMLAAAVDNATVTCGGAQVTRPAPEVPAGVDGFTPLTGEPDETPDGDGGTTPEDGGTPVDGAATPTPDEADGAAGDGDDGGGGVPGWAWVLIGVGGAAGLGAAGGFAWLRLRARARMP